MMDRKQLAEGLRGAVVRLRRDSGGPRRVLVLAKAFPPVTGGVETYSEQIVRAYCRRGYLPTVVTQTTGRRGWHEREYDGTRVRVYNTGRGGQFATGATMMVIVTLLTVRSPFDRVHATTWRAALALLGAPWRTRWIVSVHGREVMNCPWILRPFLRSTLTHAPVVVSVSSATQRQARLVLQGRHPRGQWVVAHNGLSFAVRARNTNPRNTNPSSADIVSRPLRIFTVCRHVERKNIHGSLEAVKVLADRELCDIEFRIAGTGPLTESLKARAEELGIAQRVVFEGRVTDDELVDLYRWSDVFLHPHTNFGADREFEGFGIVIADAMSFGAVPIVGAGDGPEDFVIPGRTGYVVDGTDVAAIASSIASLCRDRARLSELAASGREFVLREMSWTRHIAITEEALEHGRSGDK